MLSDDDEEGQLFHSKHFPTIKSFFHTGFDLERGAYNYKELFLPHPIDNYVVLGESAISDDTPFYTKITQGKMPFVCSDLCLKLFSSFR